MKFKNTSQAIRPHQQTETTDDCRTYDPAQLKSLDDRRFIHAKNEGIFAQLLCIVSVLLEFGVAYAMCPEDVSQMTCILGFPTWFFLATCIAVGTYLVMILYCLKFSRRFSLDARGDDSEVPRHE